MILFGSVAPVMKLAPKEGIEVIAGVEMCSTYEGRCFHILGYGFDCSNPILLAHLAHNCRLLEETDERAIGILSEEGWPVSIKEYRAYVYDPRRGGFKALFYLIDKGLCRDVKDFFSRIFIKKRGLDFPVFPLSKRPWRPFTKLAGWPFWPMRQATFMARGLLGLWRQ